MCVCISLTPTLLYGTQSKRSKVLDPHLLGGNGILVDTFEFFFQCDAILKTDNFISVIDKVSLLKLPQET